MKKQIKKITIELVINENGQEVNSLDTKGLTGNECLALLSWASYEINKKMNQ